MDGTVNWANREEGRVVRTGTGEAAGATGAGAGAADFALHNKLGRKPLYRAGQSGLREQGSTPLDSRQLIASVQAEVFPYQRNWSRQSDELQQSLQNLDGLWQQLRAGAVVGDMTERLRLREAAAMLATSCGLPAASNCSMRWWR